MIALEIDFQDGFTGQSVVVRLNDREIASLSRVMTRPQTGLAERVKVSVVPGRYALTVELPGTTLRHSSELSIEAPRYVGVNVKSTTVAVTVQDKPFRYL